MTAPRTLLAADPTREATVEDGRRVRSAMRAASIGHFVEWFDFAVYAYAAPVIAKLFFPDASPTAALLSVFAVYAAGFVARPAGAFLVGVLGDRYGRKRVLAGVVLLMGGATTLIGLLPTYATIGILAPILLVVLRLAQGLSAAGEVVGANSFIAEHSPIRQRGRNVGLVYTWSNLPPVLAALLVLLLTTTLAKGDYESWGWRIPFLLGAPLALVGLYMRARVAESPVFKELKQQKRVEPAPIRTVFRDHWRAMLFVFALSAVASLSYYSLTGYFYTYMTVTLGVPNAHALLSNSIALLLTFVTVPLVGILSDRVGRKPMMLGGALLAAVVAVPAYTLVGLGDLWAVIASQSLLGLALGVVFGAAGPSYVEMFPAAVRYTGASLSLNLAYTLFGGTAPFVATGLIALTGSALSPAWYVVAVCLLAALVLTRMPERKSASMLE